MKAYTAIGVMSGSSLDGLDLCLCSFTHISGQWAFKILRAETIPYTSAWKLRLSEAQNLSAHEYARLDFEFGRFIGSQVKRFRKGYPGTIDLIASHGHTIFHQPASGFTSQIGNGAAVAATARIQTVSDFRSMDIVVGGQGAPLVPMGDEYLFPGYSFCVNLGGFSNISYLFKKKRVAFDICPVNTVLNDQAGKLGHEYDKGGMLGRSGKEIKPLLQRLNTLPYYSQKPPKSLGREWISTYIQPLLQEFQGDPQNIMNTMYQHISDQISNVLNQVGKTRKKVLITGGGAHNTFLIELLAGKTRHELVLPSPEIINYKEALIFAFLGVLRLRLQANCLSSVTGAGYDSSCGALYHIL
ncbi:MAG: anhydro-N-acetylmuramic acid kinase [Bacteroidales bacterium]